MASNESVWFHGYVEKLAYELWEKRGRPSGSPEQDWFRAEQVVRHHLGSSSLHGLAFPSVFVEPNNE